MYIEVINKEGKKVKMHETTAKGCLKAKLVTLPKGEKKESKEETTVQTKAKKNKKKHSSKKKKQKR